MFLHEVSKKDNGINLVCWVPNWKGKEPALLFHLRAHLIQRQQWCQVELTEVTRTLPPTFHLRFILHRPPKAVKNCPRVGSCWVTPRFGIWAVLCLTGAGRFYSLVFLQVMGQVRVPHTSEGPSDDGTGEGPTQPCEPFRWWYRWGSKFIQNQAEGVLQLFRGHHKMEGVVATSNLSSISYFSILAEKFWHKQIKKHINTHISCISWHPFAL